MCNDQYPLNLWNHWQTERPKTNSHNEGFHSKLNKFLQSKHPNIFKLINVFKRFESTTNVHYNQVLLQSGQKRSTKLIKKDKQVDELTKKLVNIEKE